jgi:hypothetical protein
MSLSMETHSALGSCQLDARERVELAGSEARVNSFGESKQGDVVYIVIISPVPDWKDICCRN